MQTQQKASKELFKPLTPKRNFEEVARQIRSLILSGELKPMEFLPSERDMAEAFSASRNTIREAYRILEGSGFIELKTGSMGGARVCQLDGRKVTQSLSDLIEVGNITLHNICQARITIELGALDDAMDHYSQEDIEALERTVNRDLEEMLKGGGKTSQAGKPQHVDFHVLLVQAAKNPIYQYLIASLVGISTRFLMAKTKRVGDAEHHVQEHFEIFKAIQLKDKKLAKERLKSHLLASEARISERMGGNI